MTTLLEHQLAEKVLEKEKENTDINEIVVRREKEWLEKKKRRE
jgi:hypothetical protein